MPEQIDISHFLNLKKDRTLIDARSEGEYEQAHIPGAVNIPLLNNEARKIVGTTYKQKGHEAAVSAGFELAGPNFQKLYESYNAASESAEPIFYCWRGGLRSRISATLFEWGKGRSHMLRGGYKAYRCAALAAFNDSRKIIILSGFTGTGKTEILSLLRQSGEQIIDIEGLANHKGSVLGGLGMPQQHRQEMFENLFYEEWRNLDPDKPVFLENESRKIGANVVPEGVWNQMVQAPVIDIQAPREIRLKRILAEYGIFDPSDLEFCTLKIQKRLGGLNLKLALDALHQGDIEGWAGILMDYYDRTYLHSRTEKTTKPLVFDWNWNSPVESAKSLIQAAHDHFN